LYAPAPAWRTEWLAAPNGHLLHVQQFGSPEGLPALVLHGGPGSGCSPLLARFFDPQRYRVICADQRGAGLSRPAGGTDHNTTAELLADLRLLRAHLGLPRWLVVGGSWGATLALVHAIDAPDAVSALLLRGLFLARPQDIHNFFDGARHGRPQAWQVLAHEAESQGIKLTELLHRRLMSADSAEATALHWWRWEQFLAGHADEGADPDAGALAAQVQRLRVQSHYLWHGCWLGGFGAPPLLDRCAALPQVPTLLLHGRHDRICAPEGAAELAQRVPHARLRWIDDAGHDPAHPGMIDAMVHALDNYASHGDLK
jgi:proline iminopeptidase